jgi:DNA polymerase sigma
MNNLYDIKNETNLQINSTKLDSNKNHDIKYDINNYNIQYFNNFYYINQAQYPNFGPYQNINNLFSNTQNELFTLNEEILNFEKKVDNNLKSIKIYREQIINIITNFISKVLYKNYEFEFLFYGSYSTGLSIELSDIDILIKYTIKNNNNNLNTYQNIENIISLLEKAFNKNKEKLKINQVNPIYTASVPVLKIECNLKEIIPEKIQEQLKTDYLFNFENDILKLNFDFTFNEFNNNIKKSIPSQEIIKNIKNAIEIYPNIRPILLVLKRYMQITRLNSSFHGGISSYSLFLLLYAYYLQFYEKNTNKNNNKENLGRDLLGFFSFYGNFNFGIYSIDVRNNIPINLLDKRHQNYILLIDPITGLNVAKSTFRIEDIKYVFNNAVMIINNSFFEKMNNIENNNILNELFNQFNYNNFIYNNSFIPHQ